RRVGAAPGRPRLRPFRLPDPRPDAGLPPRAPPDAAAQCRHDGAHVVRAAARAGVARPLTFTVEPHAAEGGAVVSDNSTNVRFLSAGLRGLGAISPRAAAAVVFQLFRRTAPRRRPRFTPPPDSVEHFAAGGHRLASYVWAGGGPTVVLVHGWNGTSGDLSAFVGPLRDTGRRVVAIDLPAHGRSSGRFSDLPQTVDAVEAVLRREPNVEAVIAHSFGVPATVLAAARGVPLPRVVLVSGPISVEPYLQKFAQVLGVSEATWTVMQRRLRAFLQKAGLSSVELTGVA